MQRKKIYVSGGNIIINNIIINGKIIDDKDQFLNYKNEEFHDIYDKPILNGYDPFYKNDLNSDPFDEVKAPCTPDEVKSFLGKKPHEKTYEMYAQVAHNNRDSSKSGSMTEFINFTYLEIAAKNNFAAAKLVLTSRLHFSFTPEALIDIYHSHRHSVPFKKMILQIEQRAWLPNLVHKHPTNTRLITKSVNLKDIYDVQNKVLADLRKADRMFEEAQRKFADGYKMFEQMFGRGKRAFEDKFEDKKAEEPSVEPKLKAAVKKLIEDGIDPYAELEVPKSATDEEIRKAYKAQALKCHPDKVADAEKDAAAAKFKKLGLVKEVICDPNARKYYDRKIASRAPVFAARA